MLLSTPFLDKQTTQSRYFKRINQRVAETMHQPEQVNGIRFDGGKKSFLRVRRGQFLHFLKLYWKNHKWTFAIRKQRKEGNSTISISEHKSFELLPFLWYQMSFLRNEFIPLVSPWRYLPYRNTSVRPSVCPFVADCEEHATYGNRSCLIKKKGRPATKIAEIKYYLLLALYQRAH